MTFYTRKERVFKIHFLTNIQMTNELTYRADKLTKSSHKCWQKCVTILCQWSYKLILNGLKIICIAKRFGKQRKHKHIVSSPNIQKMNSRFNKLGRNKSLKSNCTLNIRFKKTHLFRMDKSIYINWK